MFQNKDNPQELDRRLLERIARVFKAELLTWRDSLEYYPIETFLGCCLAELKNKGLITPWEESVLRQKLEE